mmetsp:Transcript_124583/g.311555  ORF Transcript_124583/g.311555 Transcript_124583/m.311555 type:complete len:481 (+) Transcript_124583:60-1502(+)
MPADHTTSSSKAGKDKAAEGEMSSREVLRLILPAAAGSFIELYEFGIFSYMSADITGNFFANGHGGSLGTWAGFAITLCVRPFGGAFFGWLADSFGRKPAMQLTIGIMLLTTLLQGMLPTFYCCGEGWGWFGLVAMLLLRVLQGLSAGGELPTAAVYITEVSPRGQLGFNLSWISLAGAFGAWSVASLVVFLFETALTKEQMLLWGWRLPYLSTIIPGTAIIVARRHLKETPDFEDLAQANVDKQTTGRLEEARSEVKTSGSRTLQALWGNYKLALLVGSLGTAIFGVLSFVPPLYGAQFIRQDYGLPANVVTFSEMMNYGIPALLAPAVGLLIDSWGAGRVYTLSVLLGGPVVPPLILYWWAHISPGQAIFSIFVGQALLGLCLALQTSVFVWVVELFPVHVRVTGVSVAYNIGVGVCGGLGPLISDAGNRVISNKGLVSAPAAYNAFFGIISLLACLGSRVLAKRGLMRVTHIRDSPY